MPWLRRLHGECVLHTLVAEAATRVLSDGNARDGFLAAGHWRHLVEWEYDGISVPGELHWNHIGLNFWSAVIHYRFGFAAERLFDCRGDPQLSTFPLCKRKAAPRHEKRR